MPTGVRGVAEASVSDAPPTPVTWSRSWRRASRSESTHHSPPVVRAVRAQVERGGPAVARPAQQPGRRGVGGGQRGQRGGDGGVGLDRPEQQQPHQHPERAAVGGGAERGLRLAAAERGVRLPAEQRPHAVGAVVGAVQRGAQRVGGGGGDLGQHAPILADAPAPARRRGARRVRKATFLQSGCVNVAFLQRPGARRYAGRTRRSEEPCCSSRRTPTPTRCSTATRSPCSSGCCSTSSSRWSGPSPGPPGSPGASAWTGSTPRALAEYDPEALAAVFTGPPALHRYPAAMAGRVQALAALVVDRYDGDAAALWRDVPDGATLLRRLKALPGFGTQKAQIFVALLGKQRGVTPPGWREAAGAYGDEGSFRSVADVVDGASLVRVREFKQAAKAEKKAAAAAEPPARRWTRGRRAQRWHDGWRRCRAPASGISERTRTGEERSCPNLSAVPPRAPPTPS